MYLLGKKNFSFDGVAYYDLKKNNPLGFRDEGSFSWKALREQCKLLNIPFKKLSDINSKKSLDSLKKMKSDCAISLVVDTIIKKKIITIFQKGIYSSHGGMMPYYRGNDCTYWSILNNESRVGITLQRIASGVDTGKIVKVSNLLVNNYKSIDEISKDLYYKFKLYDFANLFEKLKINKKIKYKNKNYQRSKQYFAMHQTLIKIVQEKLK
tara:strand:- start:15483 stop:16112 length:630 start_codon:yes stop_codon:yes gene_type:complete